MIGADTFAQFHFLRPLWLLALPLFWLLLWRYLRGRRLGGAWARVCDPALLPFVVTVHERTRTRLAGAAALLAGTLAILAAAGPVWERLPVPVFRGESALVIALDLSNSMNAADIAPSRLERAKFRIADILRMRKTGQTAIVVFAAQCFVVTPLTDDTDTLAAQLQVLESSIMPSQGSEPGEAVRQANQLLLQAGIPRGHILLITDGADDASLARARDELAATSHRLSVLAVGTREGAPVPDRSGGFVKAAGGEIVISRLADDALRAFAAAGNGLYLDITSGDGELERLNDLLDADLDVGLQRLEDLASSQWREAGPWLLLPLLPLAALGFRRGVLVLLAALLVPLGSGPAQAGWWRTDDQVAQEAFEHGRYPDAAKTFADPAWRGAAQYRAGDYEGAAASLEALDSADAHYNRGNSLARAGALEPAVAAYEDALARHPDHEDAAHNKALVEQLLKQQQSQQDQSDDDSEDGDSKGSQSSDERGREQAGNADPEQQGSGESSDSSADQDESSASSASEEQSEEGPLKPEQPRESAEEKESSEDDEQSAQLAEARNESDAERAQATEQWLRQIPDDPGGLLRRKFQYQYKKLYGDTPQRGNGL